MRETVELVEPLAETLQLITTSTKEGVWLIFV